MTTISGTGTATGFGSGILDKEHHRDAGQSLAGAAGGLIHLCIGMAYGFSVFWLPLSRALGVTRRSLLTCRRWTDVHHQLRLARRQHGLDVHSVFVLLGIAAAVCAGWAGRSRKAGFVSALCWCSGRSSAPSSTPINSGCCGSLGVIGGIGLGLGYIAGLDAGEMVPDRRGMATGMAIMGWRWRHDRRAACQPSDGSFQDPDLDGVWKPSSRWASSISAS